MKNCSLKLADALLKGFSRFSPEKWRYGQESIEAERNRKLMHLYLEKCLHKSQCRGESQRAAITYLFRFCACFVHVPLLGLGMHYGCSTYGGYR